jgi:cobalt/nickel transport system permease protein
MDNLPLARRGRFDVFDPRARLLTVIAGALVIVSLDRTEAQVFAFAGAAALLWASGNLDRAFARRLLGLESLMMVLLLTLPFSVPGTPVAQLGPLAVSREGLAAALGIVLKANAVVLLVGGLLGSLSPIALGHAMARLGVPEKLVHLLMLTVRYIDVLERELARSRRALRARAFQARANPHSWRTLGWLIGMLLVRSAERAERVAAAMRCRGFTGRFYLLDDLRWRASDSALCAVTLVGAAILLGVEASA